MSRRPAPNPTAERAAQNQQTIKSLLKLEPNKVCADCKRNKHPRWASWNLGVFVCIRCSGIHRGMGTHISRVKSVDLDSWTDEQLQSILSWGNARANKYWEAKLAQGHVPSEAKIENFIRTKYELKRWVMDGPIPDPATLDVDGDDDIPLSIVKEKQTIDRKESIRKASVGKSGAPGAAALLGASSSSSPTPKSRPAAPAIDLFGGNFDDAPTSSTPPPRASTAGPTGAHAQPKADNAPPRAAAAAAPSHNSTKDSLLGLDFFGSAQPAAPARPSSTTGSTGSGAQSRPDLKQSILSLYATAPRVQQQQPQQQQQQQGGGFVDAFSSLSFSNAPAVAASHKPLDAFSGLASLSGSSTRSPPPPATSSSSAFGGLGGGSFFDTKPAAAAAAPAQAKPAASSSGFGGLGGFDAFSSSPSPPAAKPAAAAAPPASNAFGDLFDFAAPAPAAALPSQPAMASSSSSFMNPPPGASASMNSVFNLSQPAAPSKPATSPPAATAAAATSPLAAVSANWGSSDVWGSNDGWGSSAPSATSAAAPPASAAATTSAFQNTSLAKASTSNDFGWGGSSSAAGAGTGGSFATQSIVPGAAGGFSPAPKVAADEEFGGWSSSAATPGSNGVGKSATGGFGANEDLFSNVWN
ncbi:ARF GAP with effector function(s) [Sporothrix curviconia]|uniref:ARF GAP with effector function(S) n=1 Tax=Sporothrix curviconia TaxID=1260050 RepID=A0ABP0BTP7_9PEZI